MDGAFLLRYSGEPNHYAISFRLEKGKCSTTFIASRRVPKMERRVPDPYKQFEGMLL